jgi:hypothetical protein
LSHYNGAFPHFQTAFSNCRHGEGGYVPKGGFLIGYFIGKFQKVLDGHVHKRAVLGPENCHAVTDGKAFYVEVKNPGETPRQNQLDFIEAMKNTGAIAGWCTSVDGALEIVFGGK